MITRKAKEVEKVEKQKEVIDSENLNESRGFAKRFPKVKDRVRSILRNDEYARKNYLWLCLRYWANCGHIKIIIPQDKFGGVNSPETITRACRKLFEDARKGEPKLKFLLKDSETLGRRRERETEITNYFAQKKYGEQAGVVK